MKQTPWHADALTWGYGPRLFEVFLEPTCPFSVRAFGKLDDLLAHAGEDLHLQVLRDGRLLNIAVHSGLRPSESQVASNEAMPDGDQAPDDRGDGGRVLGMRLGPLSAQARQRYRVSGEQTGVVVEGFGQHADAQDKGMAPGDVIVKAGAHMVRSPNDVATAVAEARKAGRNDVLLLVSRDGRTAFVPVDVHQAAG